MGSPRRVRRPRLPAGEAGLGGSELDCGEGCFVGGRVVGLHLGEVAGEVAPARAEGVVRLGGSGGENGGTRRAVRGGGLACGGEDLDRAAPLALDAAATGDVREGGDESLALASGALAGSGCGGGGGHVVNGTVFSVGCPG